jgi:transposase
MNYVGIDLPEKTITVCVLDQFRIVRKRRTLSCTQTESIRAFVDGLRPFQATVKATASYLWLVELIESLAQEVILAHPGKLRIITESTKKTDRLDAQILAEFLVLNMIPGPIGRPRGSARVYAPASENCGFCEGNGAHSPQAA